MKKGQSLIVSTMQVLSFFFARKLAIPSAVTLAVEAADYFRSEFLRRLSFDNRRRAFGQGYCTFQQDTAYDDCDSAAALGNREQ